jgi:hypothetical protein
MGKYKNISGGSLDLVVPGLQCYVDDGEIVDIPDFQPDGVSPIEVPLNRWEPVTDKPAKASAAKADAAPAADTSGKAAV